MSSKQIGFFNLGTGLDPNKVGKAKSSPTKIGCDACGLRDTCKNPEIQPMGQGEKGILIITEFPGKYEDRNDTIFSKEARSILAKTLDEIEVDLEKDCWTTHAVRCSTEEYEQPTGREVELCRHKLLKTIETLNPTVIITMGKLSLSAVIGHRISGRLSGTNLEAFFGEFIPDQDMEKWICPTYSIEWIMKQTTRVRGKEVIDPVLLRYWKRSIKTACKKWDRVFYKSNYRSDIFTTTDPEEAIGWIGDTLKKQVPVAYDYETNSLKPHQEGRELATASFSDGIFAYAFPYFYDNEDFLRAWFRLMRSKRSKKIAHKMDFENGWTRFKGIGKYAQGWEWDTCLGAHCLGSTKPTNQKFWTYALLGILGYDNSVDKYLKPSKKATKERGGNAINNIHKANLNEVLFYNAEDSLYCYKIYEVQKARLKIMGKKFYKGYKFFLDGAEVLSQVQNEGLSVNMESLEKNERMLTKQIERAYYKIESSPEFAKWKGGKFNPGSDTQLSKMLYEVLGHKHPKYGDSKTDEKQLERIGTDFSKSIIPYRKFKKMRDTYLAQFKREQVDGIIRPFFNLHIPATFRSSSDSPNFQNMPARDPQAMKYVMSNIGPRKGNKIIEWDYKGVEVTISACYHKDPNMIKYILDPKTDMHRDTAADIVLKKPGEVTKGERQNCGKGGFVFPSFYGSGVPAMAPAIWETITSVGFEDTRAHMRGEGVKTYRDFYAHMENVYRIFWDERFPVYRDWKRKIWHDYLKKGYVDLYTGFRYYGPAQFTQITNTQIQGSAFHVLLWSLTNIYPEVRDNFEESKIIGQIHDAVVGDIQPDDEPEIDKIVKYWGTEKVREHWPWITLPLYLEKESTEVDGTWNTMEERGFI